ncbi:respiratory chain protein [Pyrobaculum sp.]|uniref:respiratory chain protein n=1 Tax=Pyrobaculum sp. TaxID=2004705 RepID=UPI0031625AF3
MRGGSERDPSLIRVFGLIGSLSFILEGVILPVAVAAHVFLLLTYRWASHYCGRRSIFIFGVLWFAAAITASLTIAATMKLTFITVYLGQLHPAVPLAWLMTVPPFYLAVRELSRCSGIGLFQLAFTAYALGVFLLLLGLAFIQAAAVSVFVIAYAFVALALAFWKIG